MTDLNETVVNKCSLINTSPEDEGKKLLINVGWLVKIKLANAADLDKLMSGEAYEKFKSEN